MMAFAKLPSAWVRLPSTSTSAQEGFVPVTEYDGPAVFAQGGLMMLQWRTHQGSASAALLILFALAVVSNRRQRTDGLRLDNTVAATYEEIQAMMPLSRKLIAGGLELLEQLGAIGRTRQGRHNVFTLNGIERNGSWCALPQSHLLDRHPYLHRLGWLADNIRNPKTLHALKLYMLLLTHRENHSNLASISYEKIGWYTGLRRADISRAIKLLTSCDLCSVLGEREAQRRFGPGSDEGHYFNRYKIHGLHAA